MGQYSPAKAGEYPRIFPNFQNRARCEKDLKDNKHNSLHLGRKYVRIFVLGHYLFLVAHSFPRATLSENCSLLGTDNVRGQISWHIFAPNGGYCLYSARPRKIPGWIVIVRENLSVNKRVCRKKKQLKLYEAGFVCFPIQIFHLAFTAFISKS